jgi:hypothetical protein
MRYPLSDADRSGLNGDSIYGPMIPHRHTAQSLNVMQGNFEMGGWYRWFRSTWWP